MIDIPRGLSIAPQEQLANIVSAAAEPTRDADRDLERLRRLVLMHAPGSAPFDDSEPIGPGVSSAGDPGQWLIGFSDLQAHEESDRIDRFVDELATSPDMGRVYREDRELPILRTSDHRSGGDLSSDSG